jgi:hypothetical protein
VEAGARDEPVEGQRHSSILKQPEDVTIGVGDGSHCPIALAIDLCLVRSMTQRNQRMLLDS